MLLLFLSALADKTYVYKCLGFQFKLFRGKGTKKISQENSQIFAKNFVFYYKDEYYTIWLCKFVILKLVYIASGFCLLLYS